MERMTMATQTWRVNADGYQLMTQYEVEVADAIRALGFHYVDVMTAIADGRDVVTDDEIEAHVEYIMQMPRRTLAIMAQTVGDHDEYLADSILAQTILNRIEANRPGSRRWRR
jgi:hypothetical protein